MKKILFSLLLLILVSVCAEARYLKIIGGLTSPKNNFDNIESDSKLTFTGGIGIDTVMKKTGFVSEFLFSYEKVNLALGGINNEYRFIKLGMPLLFKYKLKEFHSPYVVVGGSGTIIFAKHEVVNGNTSALFAFSLVIGAGMDIDLINKEKMINSKDDYRWPVLTIEGRYQKQLNELKLEERPFKSSSFFILIGIKF